jgi:hypothetical protein
MVVFIITLIICTQKKKLKIKGKEHQKEEAKWECVK